MISVVALAVYDLLFVCDVVAVLVVAVDVADVFVLLILMAAVRLSDD